MKLLKTLTQVAVLSGILAISSSLFAAEQAKAVDGKSAKPYTLKTCLVSDEKFGGDMGKPYVFVYQGQEIKLCCKGCLKDFNKEPAKYIKKLAAAEKEKKNAQPGGSAHDHGGH